MANVSYCLQVAGLLLNMNGFVAMVMQVLYSQMMFHIAFTHCGLVMPYDDIDLD